jgi:hypothetical protein
MKTLVTILHYNTPELTDNLYNTLKPFEKDIYNLAVIDNGSHHDKKSKYASYVLDKNYFYGGGVNAILEMFLESSQYDSLMILNSDIICHGENYIKTLREELFSQNFMLISPCILEPYTGNQTIWKSMRPWHTNTTRSVPWIDFQAPLMQRKFVEALYPIDPQLIYGWGIDILSGIICEENNWKIGVCDKVPSIHLISQTIKQNLDELSNVNNLAEKNMFEYFEKTKNFNKFTEIRNKSFNYSI